MVVSGEEEREVLQVLNMQLERGSWKKLKHTIWESGKRCDWCGGIGKMRKALRSVLVFYAV